MSSKNKIKRVSKIFILLIVVMSMVLWLMPVGSLYGVTEEDCVPGDLTSGDVSGVIYLDYPQTKHAGLPYTDFLNPDECKNTPEQFVPGPGEVLWHLILTNFTEGSTLSLLIEGVGAPYKITGGAAHWYIVNTATTAPDWKLNIRNGIEWIPGTGCLSTDLKVSHTCYGGDVCEGDLTVVKTINGQTPLREQSFDFYLITPDGARRGPFTLDSGNSWTYTFENLPCDRKYSIQEDLDSLPSGIVFGEITYDDKVLSPVVDGNNIEFDIGSSTQYRMGTITIDNTEECKGEVTVKKFLNGGTPTGGFAVDFFVKVGDTTRGPFTLNSGNGWSMTFDTLPCDEVIEIWEDETSLPAGVVFDKIRSTIDGAVINGNSIIFTAASGDNGTIGIMNKEECTGKVTVVKYIDDKVATEGSFTIKISYGDVTREFILDASNGWSKTLNLPCDIEYKIWEDEGSLPGGIVFSKIRSTIQGAVIAGNSIIFTVSSGDNGAIGIMNTEELYKIIVKKTTDGSVEANTDFNFNLVGPGTNVTKTIKAGAGSSGNTTFENLKAGSYTLTETNTGFNTWVSFSPDPKTSGSPGKTVTISLPQDADKKNTVYVYFHNDPTNGGDGNGKKDGDGDGIEVLGIQELPFTGFNWIYYVIGMALIIAGGFTSISVTKLLRRKEQ